MTEVLEADLHDPDFFADEWQECLWTDGPRSARARQLMRIARERPGAELERIFEAKLAEFQRYRNHREDREATVWNFPLRFVESLWDDVRFSPRGDVLMTLIYVFLAVAALEFLKPTLRWPTADQSRAPRAEDSARNDVSEGASVLPAKVDAWLADEFQRAADAIDLRAVITNKLRANLEQANLENLLNQKIEEFCRSTRLEEAVLQQLQATVSAAVAKGINVAGAASQSPSRSESSLPPSQVVERIDESLAKQQIDANTRDRLRTLLAEEPVRKAMAEVMQSLEDRQPVMTVDPKASPTTAATSVGPGAGK